MTTVLEAADACPCPVLRAFVLVWAARLPDAAALAPAGWLKIVPPSG